MPSTCDITRLDAESLLGLAKPEWSDRILEGILEAIYGERLYYNFCIVEKYDPNWHINYPDVKQNFNL